MKENDFNRYFTGNMSNAEKRAFLAEIAADPTLRRKYVRMKNVMGLVAYVSDWDNETDMSASGSVK